MGFDKQFRNSGDDNDKHNQHHNNKREGKSNNKESLSPEKDEERD